VQNDFAVLLGSGLAKFVLSLKLQYNPDMFTPQARESGWCTYVYILILPSIKGLFGKFPNNNKFWRKATR